MLTSKPLAVLTCFRIFLTSLACDINTNLKLEPGVTEIQVIFWRSRNNFII